MAKEQKIYVVTNSTFSGNYTPSVFGDEEEAKKWFYELGLQDAMDAFDDDMLEILCDKIKREGKDVIEKIKCYIEEFDNEPAVMAGDDLNDDTAEAYVSRAVKLIEELNLIMEKSNIPFVLEYDDEEDPYDITDILDSFIDDLEKEEFYLEDILENKKKEALEFFSKHILGIEVGDSSIRLDYSDDNFNHIQFFETTLG